MQGTPSNISGLSLKPLGAGDLIDRAVRFYRRNFWTFLAIGAPPVLLGTILLIAWNFVAAQLFTVDYSRPTEGEFYRLFVGFGSIVIWFAQMIAVLAVMGGASRNFVRHLLFGEPITFQETYKNTKRRLPGLLLVSVLVTLIMIIVGIFVFYAWFLLFLLSIVLAGFVGQFIQILAIVIGVVLGIVLTLGALWLFFAALSRFVYIPQVMLVEGLGAFPAIGRSLSLAGKNVTRVGSLFVFTIISTYSVLLLLYVPLWLLGWSQGINISDWESAEALPAWYEVSRQVLNQTSLILMFPVLVIGLCLLYIDERVRSEGYDLELLAARILGEMPEVPDKFVNPLQPALSTDESPTAVNPSSGGSSLGLNG